MRQRTTLYLCDPEKNTDCRKNSCEHNPLSAFPVCKATKYPEFAKLDESGKPIRLPDWREEFIAETKEREGL